jgi:hypothetical protein
VEGGGDVRTRDYIDGQRTVQLADREFAIVGGRRWTRVFEYLSNGQLTARWFVDEKTREVRMAEGVKKPKSWPIGGSSAAFVLDLLTLPASEDAPARGPFDGYLTQKADGTWEVAAAGVVVACTGDEEMGRALLAEHADGRPQWKVAGDGAAVRIG